MRKSPFATAVVTAVCLLASACAAGPSGTSGDSQQVTATVLECREAQVPVGPATSRTYTAASIRFLVTNPTGAPVAIQVQDWNVQDDPLIVPPGDSLHEGDRKGACPAEDEPLVVTRLNSS